MQKCAPNANIRTDVSLWSGWFHWYKDASCKPWAERNAFQRKRGTPTEGPTPLYHGLCLWAWLCLRCLEKRMTRAERELPSLTILALRVNLSTALRAAEALSSSLDLNPFARGQLRRMYYHSPGSWFRHTNVNNHAMAQISVDGWNRISSGTSITFFSLNFMAWVHLQLLCNLSLVYQLGLVFITTKWLYKKTLLLVVRHSKTESFNGRFKNFASNFVRQ